MKVKPFILTNLTINRFTFRYLPLTITGLPTYHNRSTCLKSKTSEGKSGIKMETNKEELENGEAVEALPKNRYTLSMIWEVEPLL